MAKKIKVNIFDDMRESLQSGRVARALELDFRGGQVARVLKLNFGCPILANCARVGTFD